MRERTARGLAAICALLALTAATVSITRHMPPRYSLMSVTEIKPDNHGNYIVEAEIDGTTVRAIVDTGATAVALSFKDAEDAGLHPQSLDFDVAVNTANGLTHAAKVSLRRVEVDGVEARDVEGLVLPDGVMEGTLLGMSYLSRLRTFKVEDGVLHLEN